MQYNVYNNIQHAVNSLDFNENRYKFNNAAVAVAYPGPPELQRHHN